MHGVHTNQCRITEFQNFFLRTNKNTLSHNKYTLSHNKYTLSHNKYTLSLNTILSTVKLCTLIGKIMHHSTHKETPCI